MGLNSLGECRPMKRKVLFLAVLLTTVVITSCSVKKLIYSDVIAEENCEEIMDYLSNNDEEELKKMFCKRTAEGGLFEIEIEKAMEFFQGEVVSHDSLVGKTGGGHFAKNGKIMELDIRPHISNIETDADKTYDIRFYSYLIYEEDKDVVGISQLTITDMDTDEEFTVGKLIK